MRQRVAIAIALVNGPDLIIADEPTTALDVTIQGQILFEMQKVCRESGTALIWITHDLSVIAGLADEVCVMYAGRFVESGTVADVLDRPLHPYTRGLIDSVPSRNERGRPLRQIPGHDALAPVAGAGLPLPRALRVGHAALCRDSPAVTEPAPGRRLRCFHPLAMSATSPAPAPLLELRGISKRFTSRLDLAARIAARLGAGAKPQTVHALDGVDLAIGAGEVVGLVGESGCGKSTLGRIVARILEPSEGERRWMGPAVRRLRVAGIAKRAARGADGLPGPLRLAQPPHAHRRRHRRGARGARPRRCPRARDLRRAGHAARRDSTRASRGASRTSFPAGSAAASASPARWP